MNNIAIEMSNLSKSYKLYEKPIDRLKEAFSGNQGKYCTEKKVLNQINLQIKSGEVVGIIGTNGAGKSTLLKIVTGVLTPSSGNLKVNGKTAALLELGTGFNPEFTGIKNIFLNGSMMGFSHDEMEQKLGSIIDFADIGDFIYHPVKTYSSGMFARLAFAVAINVDPEILIVDEALSVGDLRFQMKCMDKMKSMMDSGITVLFVSHDINAIRRLCTKTIWLKEGNIQAYGETNKVCDQYMDFLKLGEFDSIEKIADNTVAAEHLNDLKPFSKRNKDIVAEIQSVYICDSQGKQIENLDIFVPAQIKVIYDVYDDAIDAPVLGIALKRVDDEYICGVNTLLDHVKIPWRYGRNSFSLIYKSGIRVLGGIYYLDVALFDKTATVPIHYWAKIKEFTVTADYIGEGICIIPHEWSK